MRVALIITSIVATIGSNALAEDAAVRSHPIEECLEAGEFIRNAALSRDNGISREYFMSRLSEDLMAIRAFPPQLRWFVRNELDEALLTNQRNCGGKARIAIRSSDRRDMKYSREIPLSRDNAALRINSPASRHSSIG